MLPLSMPTFRASTYQGYVPRQARNIEALITSENCVFDKTCIGIRTLVEKESYISKGVICRDARRSAETLCVIHGGDDTFA